MSKEKPSDATRRQYRKKPVVIEAVQWFKDGDHPEVKPHGHGQYDPLSLVTCGSCGQEMFWKSSLGGGVGVMHFTHGEIKTLESAKGSAHIVCPGDWIIKGVKGEHYACKPDIFAATYEPAETATPSAVSAIDFAPVVDKAPSSSIDAVSDGSADENAAANREALLTAREIIAGDRININVREVRLARALLRFEHINALLRELVKAKTTPSAIASADDNEDAERWKWFRDECPQDRRIEILEVSEGVADMLDHHVDKGRVGL